MDFCCKCSKLRYISIPKRKGGHDFEVGQCSAGADPLETDLSRASPFKLLGSNYWTMAMLRSAQVACPAAVITY